MKNQKKTVYGNDRSENAVIEKKVLKNRCYVKYAEQIGAYTGTTVFVYEDPDEIRKEEEINSHIRKLCNVPDNSGKVIPAYLEVHMSSGTTGSRKNNRGESRKDSSDYLLTVYKPEGIYPVPYIYIGCRTLERLAAGQTGNDRKKTEIPVRLPDILSARIRPYIRPYNA